MLHRIRHCLWWRIGGGINLFPQQAPRQCTLHRAAGGCDGRGDQRVSRAPGLQLAQQGWPQRGRLWVARVKSLLRGLKGVEPAFGQHPRLRIGRRGLLGVQHQAKAEELALLTVIAGLPVTKILGGAVAADQVLLLLPLDHLHWERKATALGHSQGLPVLFFVEPFLGAAAVAQLGGGPPVVERGG